MAEAVITLPAEAVTFVRNGGRDIDTAKLAALASVAAGERVRLVDDSGDDLGLAVSDPDNQRLRVMATPDDGFPRIDGALLGWRVERALAWRTKLDLPGPESCYRLLHHAGDGLPGFTCDVLGPHAVLYAYSAALLPLARLLADAVRGFAKLKGVVVKVRARGGASEVTQEVVGDTPPERYVALERGVPVEIHPMGGLNVGLFTDMREHRVTLARYAPGRTVLNLFSYTGMLSLACARAGATSVTSVDTSDGVQAWARGNFGRSNLTDAARWRFETGDAVRFLARAAKTRERYDLVLVDPPTFSTARGKAWTLDRDYPELIAQAAAVIPEGGILWLAANTHELGSLVRLAQRGLRGRGAVFDQGSLPPDYPTLAAQPRDRYLQVISLRL
ncbi:MAG TPA: class I SAM-dependent methyltransferase [Kofleriaceae bacterium]|nr:class I SAM-dependent methyltransferase [Kofleriaceae bacterium]